MWQVADAEVDAAIAVALETGYRSIDSGRLYGNEVGVGRALEATDLAREDLFVSTMVWNDDHGFLKDETGEFPAINQVELHPYLQQAELRDFHAANGILTEAWSPLASGGGGVLSDHVIRGIADNHGVTPAQAILRWHTQIGNVVIPKSHPQPDRRELRPRRLRARPWRPRLLGAAGPLGAQRTRPRHLQPTPRGHRVAP